MLNQPASLKKKRKVHHFLNTGDFLLSESSGMSESVLLAESLLVQLYVSFLKQCDRQGNIGIVPENIDEYVERVKQRIVDCYEDWSTFKKTLPEYLAAPIIPQDPEDIDAPLVSHPFPLGLDYVLYDKT